MQYFKLIECLMLNGSVVFWNIRKDVRTKILSTVIHEASDFPYKKCINVKEAEHFIYEYDGSGNSKNLVNLKDGRIYLKDAAENEKIQINLNLIIYCLSDAISLSVKLSVLESQLRTFIKSIENNLKTSKNIEISRRKILMKAGELLDIRHSTNLNIDLIDLPDTYWDRPVLEKYFLTMKYHLNISQRNLL
ncbi:hypothetical protein A3Q56_00558 [Intoshia linei]|uniref:DUF155 domain-containing protein n=1 Tax=Intoshia linei TaxID=1819745 RepID=A0A177BDM3_9BILA|nr:hypothetical protein A3Q56_00558 [Intoshia linei]